MADKLRAQLDLEQLQQRHVGTLHPDSTKYEWLSNMHRDSSTSMLGHPALLSYMAIARNVPRALAKTDLIEGMIRPCGPPPFKEDA
jgi:splicing factor 3B subunit 5